MGSSASVTDGLEEGGDAIDYQAGSGVEFEAKGTADFRAKLTNAKAFLGEKGSGKGNLLDKFSGIVKES
jgi:hypothetical protein